jgi:HprK-related kinase A
MKLKQESYARFRRRLRAGMTIQTGPLNIVVQSAMSDLARLLYPLYGEYRIAAEPVIADLHMSVVPGTGLRRWLRPQVKVLLDGQPPFRPFPRRLALPLLEWGINWGIAIRCHQYLMLHAAVVEKHGCAVILPALPGHGKTTLCAGLIHRGWRLLSDEFGMLRPEDGHLVPIPRLLPLKNASIEVIRRFAPQAHIGPSFPETHKGTVAHLRPPAESIDRDQQTVPPGLVVFPRWQAAAETQWTAVDPPAAFLQVATNAFNYETLGETGFRSVVRLIRSCPALQLVYSDLDEAIEELDGKISVQARRLQESTATPTAEPTVRSAASTGGPADTATARAV